MKTILTLLFVLFWALTYGQSFTDDDLIQNFYVSCKAGSYGAFLDLQKGTQLLETKQYNRSMKCFNDVLEKDSSCCDAYYMLAYCNQKQKNFPEAIINCDKSISLNEKNPSAWVIKGNTFLLLNDTVNATFCFHNAIKYAQEQIDGYYGIALVLFIQNKRMEALAIINRYEFNSTAKAVFSDKRKMNKLKEKLVL